MNKPPKSILDDIAWDFLQDAPESMAEFIDTLKQYNEWLFEASRNLTLPAPRYPMGRFIPPVFDRLLRLFLRHDFRIGADSSNLTDAIQAISADTGLHHLFVRYRFTVETETGGWEDVTRILEIKTEQTLTEGGLLFHIQQQAKADLADQDHRFFEGLVLDKRAKEKSTPTYEMWLGS